MFSHRAAELPFYSHGLRVRIKVDSERLVFWANHDPAAYLDFIEELFKKPVSDGWTEQLLEPLKRIWMAGGANPDLDARLRRWLILVWHRDLQSKSQFTEGNYILPVARSQQQLVLSNVALAILAENPVPTFLANLAVAAATDHLSRQEHVFTDPKTGREK